MSRLIKKLLCICVVAAAAVGLGTTVFAAQAEPSVAQAAPSAVQAADQQQDTASAPVSVASAVQPSAPLLAPAANPGSPAYHSPTSPFGYIPWNVGCTRYAWGRTYEATGICPPVRYDAGGWLNEARAAGWETGMTPRANAIAVWGGGYGHVAFVESVSGGTVHITEGGWSPGNGYYMGNPYWHEEYIPLSIMSTYGSVRGGNYLIGYIYITPAEQKVTKLRLNTTMKTVGVGKTLTLKSSASPTNATNKAVSWKSSNTKIAKVSSRGVVKGLKAGKVTITAKAKDGSGKTVKATIYVGKRVKSVSLVTKVKTLSKGQAYTLKKTFSPSDAANKGVTWKSSNTKIAKVSSKGVVKALKNGKVTITCTTKDGKKTSKCTIYVGKKVKSVKLNASYRTVAVGKSTTLKKTLSPADAANKNVSWKSSNTKIAKVSKTGKVTGVKAGKVTITCTTQDGKKTAKCTIYVGKSVKSVKLDASYRTVAVGKSTTLKKTLSPADAANKNVSWKSSNTKIARVDKTGKVTGVKAGKVTITCTTQDGKKTAKCTIYVGKSVQGVKLNTGCRTVAVGGSTTLKKTFTPADAANKNVSWKSSNSAIAKVDKYGKVTGVKAGKATITCTTQDGKKTASCTIYVGNAVSGIRLDRSSASLYTGEKLTLKATLSPSTAANKNVAWTSSNTRVAQVDAAGRVTAVGSGAATITAKTQDGAKTAACVLTVRNRVTVNIAQETVSLAVGQSEELDATADIAGSPLCWTSSDDTIARVDSDGTVTALAPGDAVITVTATDGGIADSCSVQVTLPELRMPQELLSLTEGDSFSLPRGIALPISEEENAATQDAASVFTGCTWASNDESTATVDADGVVTALAAGQVTITATAADGSIAQCVITVLPKQDEGAPAPADVAGPAGDVEEDAPDSTAPADDLDPAIPQGSPADAQEPDAPQGPSLDTDGTEDTISLPA